MPHLRVSPKRQRFQVILLLYGSVALRDAPLSVLSAVNQHLDEND